MPERSKEWLEEAFRRIGFADEARELAEWELESAELAKRVWLRAAWRDTIERWRDVRTLGVYPQARKLLEAGADPETLRLLCGSVALDTLAYIEHHIDYGFDPEFEDLPGWELIERDPETDELTGRRVGFLHETGHVSDPRGEEGREFWKGPDDAPGIDFSKELSAEN